MDNPVKDYDIVTNATPDQVIDLFKPLPEYSQIPVGEQFGVINIVEKSSQCSVEVATFREESGYSDQRHPDRIKYVTSDDPTECMQLDSARRDFTFNAMYWNLTDQREVFDPLGGMSDITDRIVRFIGEPEDRIKEDPLRMLRFVRFVTRFDFSPCSKAAKAIRENSELVKSVSKERIRDELTKILIGPRAGDGILLLEQLRLLKHVLSDVHNLTIAPKCNQSPEHHPEGTVMAHTALMLNGLRGDVDPVLAWGVLLHDIAKPDTYHKENSGKITNKAHAAVGDQMSREILRGLKFPNQFIDDVCTLVKHHMDFVQVQEMRRSTLKKLFARRTFDLELELHRVDCRYSNGRLDNYFWLKEIRDQMPPEVVSPEWFVTGRDVMDILKIKEGRKVGEILEIMHNLQLEDVFEDRNAALEHLSNLCEY
jgi:poly(A) polymerase